MTRPVALWTLLAALLSAGCSLTIDPSQYEPKAAGDCRPGEKPCGYKCVPNDDPATGCGEAYCSPCPAVGANAVVACTPEGTCGLRCDPTWGNCDGSTSDGCETPVTTGVNCGACGRACSGATCDPVDYVCQPTTSFAMPGAVQDLEVDPPDGSAFALVKGIGSSELRQIAFSGGSPIVKVSGLGEEVPGLAIGDDEAWFSRKPTAGDPNELCRLRPLYAPGVFEPKQTHPATSAPGDVELSTIGPIWIAGAGRLFWLDSVDAVSELLPGRSVRAIACPRPPLVQCAAAHDGAGGTILDPFASEATLPWVTGAGTVGALVVASSGGLVAVYWADLATGDVKRYRPSDQTVTTIFKGAGPTSAMDLAANLSGDVFWTNAATGEVRMYGQYGAYPAEPHLVAKSPKPGKVTAGAGRFLWVDESDGMVRIVPR